MVKKGKISKFIQKVWDLLDNEEEFKEIVCWCEQGISFKIVDPDIFEEVILSKHFKHTNVSSFIRQLNMYSFHKVNSN